MMNRYVTISPQRIPRPVPLWRILVIAIGVSILCSCQALDSPSPNGFVIADDDRALSLAPDTDLHGEAPLAPLVNTGRDAVAIRQTDYPMAPAPPASNMSVTCVATSNNPRPRDEYVCDGGDGLYKSRPGLSLQYGVEPSDTVAQFDSNSQDAVVVASSRDCIYAPRFAAARKIIKVEHSARIAQPGGLHFRSEPLAQSIPTTASHVDRNLAPEGQIATTIRHELFENTSGILVNDTAIPKALGERQIPFEGRAKAPARVYQQETGARDVTTPTVAVNWNNIETVEIIVDGEPGGQLVGVGQASETYMYAPPSHPKLSLQKNCENNSAKPGEVVVFEITYKNIGDEPIRNLRVLDNLPARLQYVQDSQSCTDRALFQTEENSAGSLALRWEVRQDLLPGDHGSIRFECLVR